MRKEKKDCEKGFEENDRWYYYSYWSSSCSCNHFNVIRFAKMGATLWLLFLYNRKFLRISYYTKTGAGMRTRAYKEDVATQPRSAREFALQTLCSFMGTMKHEWAYVSVAAERLLFCMGYGMPE